MMRVTVVIPSHDDAVLLRACLAALRTQNRPADEVIVVDNACTDDTAEVARAAGARVVTEPLRGVTPATACGFDAARGDLLLRLDADSVPPPDWVARVVAAFTDPTLGALSGPGRFYGGNAVTRWIGAHLYIGGYATVVPLLLGHPVLFGSNLALRRAVWERIRHRVHRREPHVHDDLDISINLPPGTTVRFDRSLRVGVSARPFDSARGLWRRVAWAGETVAINHREQSMLARRREWRAAPGIDRLSRHGRRG